MHTATITTTMAANTNTIPNRTPTVIRGTEGDGGSVDVSEVLLGDEDNARVILVGLVSEMGVLPG